MPGFHDEEQRAARRRRIELIRRWDPRTADWPDLIGADLPRPKGSQFPRVAFVGSDYGGAGRLRSFWPALAMSEAGVNVTWASTEFPRRGSFDVLWVHRIIHDAQLKVLDRLLAPGVVLIHDEDDAIDRLPAGFDYGRYENERAAYERFLANHRSVLGRASALTVSTPFLVEHFGGQARRVFLCPNYLPAWIAGCRLERPPGDMVRVGWAGIVGTHAHDLEWLSRCSRRMLRGAMFTTVGNGRDTMRTLRIPGAIPHEAFPVEFSLRRFYELMGRADVGIVPLAPGLDLNRGKSYLKMLEYFMLGIPVVAARYPEQERLMVDGETGFLADDPLEFAERVQELVWSPALRERMGRAARARAFEFTLEDHVAEWTRVLDAVAGRDMLSPIVAGAGAGRARR